VSTPNPPRAPWWKRALLLAACVIATGAVVPRTLVGRDADALFDGELAAQDGLARAVADTELGDVGARSFHTGSARFDGEWAVATHQMAALGLAQVIAAHPALRPRYLPALRRAVDHLFRPVTWDFAREAWGHDPIERLDTDEGHAYLGYVALAMGALRGVDPGTPHAALHDRIVAALARRLERSRDGVIETYPGEAYPCDIAAVVGAVGQHARLTGTDRRALLARMSRVYHERFTHRASGYLAQSVDPLTGVAHHDPRGSGTALAAYFLSFADASLARELGGSLARTGHTTLAGFAAVREYAPGTGGLGDVDSGPVVFGVSVSATGFALATARQMGDRERYRELFRTAALFGVPVRRGGGWRFVTGGPIGNAILLAMLTARAP
jgi:hypothetical protein